MRRAGLLSIMFVMMLNATTLTVAAPAITDDYPTVDAAAVHWLLAVFLLILAVVAPATGWLLKRFTRRTLLLVGVITFLLGTVSAALEPPFAVLLLARVVQAFGTAVLVALSNTTGSSTTVILLALGLGPVIAGIVLSVTTWHGIFWAMVPVVAIAGLFGTLRLPEMGGAGRGRRRDRQLLDSQPLKHRNFVLSLLVLLALVAAMLGTLSIMALYLTEALELPAVVTGLVVAPLMVFPAALAPAAVSMYERFGPRMLGFVGLVMVTGSLCWMAFLQRDTHAWLVTVMVLVCALGLAIAFAPLRWTAMHALPTALQTSGSQLLAMCLPFAGAAGMIAMGSMYREASWGMVDQTMADVSAYAASIAFLTAGVISVAPLALSLFITRNHSVAATASSRQAL